MPRSEKWLVELNVTRPTLEVAREILRQRLKVMSRLLENSVDANDDVEVVHDLRVCTRRTDAALLLFKPLLPKKRRSRLRKKLRQLRSAAGLVRDCDVHWKHLIDAASPNRDLLKTVKSRRKQARKELQQVQKKLIRKHRFSKQARKLIYKLEKSAALASECRDYPDFARRSLQEHASSFFNLATLPPGGDEILHPLRIAAKRWRYALELSSGVLVAPWASELYDQLSEIQDRLGELHDLETLCGRMENYLDAQDRRRNFKIRKAMEQQQERLAELRGEFGRWWTAEWKERIADTWRRANGYLAGNPQQTCLR